MKLQHFCDSFRSVILNNRLLWYITDMLPLLLTDVNIIYTYIFLISWIWVHCKVELFCSLNGGGTVVTPCYCSYIAGILCFLPDIRCFTSGIPCENSVYETFMICNISSSSLWIKKGLHSTLFVILSFVPRPWVCNILILVIFTWAP